MKALQPDHSTYRNFADVPSGGSVALALGLRMHTQ